MTIFPIEVQARDSQHGDPDRYQNLITCSFYRPGPLYKILSQSVHNYLSNVANSKQTERQDKQTNATGNTTVLPKR